MPTSGALGHVMWCPVVNTDPSSDGFRHQARPEGEIDQLALHVARSTANNLLRAGPKAEIALLRRRRVMQHGDEGREK